MAEIFRADEDDWKWIKCGNGPVSRCIHELRDRVAALEAAPDRVLVRNQTGEYLRTGMPLRMDSRFYVDPRDLLTSSSESPATSPPAEPSDEELWELRRAAQQGRTSMENWITRAEIHGNRALFDAGVEWATRRAEQQTTTEEPSAAQPASASPDTPQSLHDVALAHVDSIKFRDYRIPPEILDTIRRAIREPMVTPPEPGKVATDEELRSAWASAYDAAEYGHGYRDEMRFVDGLRGVYSFGRRHGAPACPHVRSNAAMNWCALTEQSALAEPDPEPAPLPPIRVGQKWRRFDGKTVYVVSPRDSALGYAFVCRASNDEGCLTYTAEGKYINDSLPRGECGRDLAELVEDAPEPAPAEPAPPAPAGGLVEEVMEAAEVTAAYAKWALDAVADWLERHQSTHETEPDSIDYAAYLLRQEATR